MTKLGNIVDETDNVRARNTLPDFGPDGAADTELLDNEMGELPSWMRPTAARPTVGGRWKQTVLLWGGSLLTLAVLFGAALWLLDEHNNERAMAVVARAELPAAPAAPEWPSGASALPPLVLLSEQVTVAAVPAPLKVRTKAPVAKIAPKKAVLAKSAAVQPKAKIKKPLVLAKHAPAPAPAKAKAKPKLLASAVPRPATAHRCLPSALARGCANRR